jgi:hypothetical protein
MMDLTEANIQVLASIYRIDKEGSRAGDATPGAQSGGCLTRYR